jgi:hypothetical protein
MVSLPGEGSQLWYRSELTNDLSKILRDIGGEEEKSAWYERACEGAREVRAE